MVDALETSMCVHQRDGLAAVAVIALCLPALFTEQEAVEVVARGCSAV